MNDRDFIVSLRDQCNAQLGAAPPQPPQGETCGEFVNRMYQQYAHTAPDSGGFSYWVGQCSAGVPRSQIEAAFAAAYPTPAPPVTPPGGNPAAIQPSIPWGEVRQQQSHSGIVMAFPIDQWRPGEALVIYQGQQPASAANVVTEFTVSQAPGVIDPASTYYYRSVFMNNNTMTMPEVAKAAGWFLNIRWTYPAEPAHGYCQFSLRWAA